MNLAAQIFEQLDDANRAAAQHLAMGREQGQREGKAARDALSAVVKAYDKALADPLFVAPTEFHARMEAARSVL